VSGAFPSTGNAVPKVTYCLVHAGDGKGRQREKTYLNVFLTCSCTILLMGQFWTKPEIMVVKYQVEEDPMLAFNFSLPVR